MKSARAHAVPSGPGDTPASSVLVTGRWRLFARKGAGDGTEEEWPKKWEDGYVLRALSAKGRGGEEQSREADN